MAFIEDLEVAGGFKDMIINVCVLIFMYIHTIFDHHNHDDMHVYIYIYSNILK